MGAGAEVAEAEVAEAAAGGAPEAATGGAPEAARRAPADRNLVEASQSDATFSDQQGQRRRVKSFKSRYS